MESLCRGCLSKHDPIELIQYSEKNRRLFVYSTGLQVKRNDAFIFQLCKECCLSMKTACNFKKNCRNSDKKLKSYIELKESGENVEFCTFLKNTDETIKFRLPINIGNSTPAHQKIRDDDNDSTCTSIQNFMTDILQAEEIPDSEARIIREVIEEEADILEDSLDSHWLQDDVSVDSDYRLDFSFSPFSTPRSAINENQFSPIKMTDQIKDSQTKVHNPELIIENVADHNVENIFTSKPAITLNDSDFQKEFNLNVSEDKKCVIDVNLENALRNDTAQKVSLEELISTPPMIPNISGPPTPVIKNILFGDSIDLDDEMTQNKNYDSQHPKEELRDIQPDIDVIDEFLNVNHVKGNTEDIEFSNSLMDLDEVESIDRYINKTSKKDTDDSDIKRSMSPIENKYCITNFYCKMCKRQFKNLLALKVHCTKYHKFKIEKPKTKRIRKQYICDFCGKLFASSRCIVKHLEKHQKPKTYECKKCTMIFKTEAGMRLHESSHTGIRIRNNNSKKYVCSICGAVCSSSSNYNIHKRRHLNKFTKSCVECGKGFYRTTDLEIHMRKHTGERPFECKYCSRSFSRQDVLNRHMKCHTGEKPFTCQFCDTKFCKSYELKSHQSKSKLCIHRQMEVIKEKNDVENEILVTNAFVF
ncbi:zinc finger protein 662-like [Vanessa cardui]|uniref:zinc finger protein 662-like n=2 Tax=Vanessa cardui TaxID=171605 RepID=UPI001F1296B4|nr:zinc finger protein 662-like [Vanessa cardui]